MDKIALRKLLLEQLRYDLSSAQQAVADSHARATHEECQARSQYDTFALEASYLANGQTRRVQALQEALLRLQALPMRPFSADSPIDVTALVQLQDRSGKDKWVFILPDAGGQKLKAQGQVILTVNPEAPLAESLIGKQEGDEVEVMTGSTRMLFEIISVR